MVLSVGMLLRLHLHCSAVFFHPHYPFCIVFEFALFVCKLGIAIPMITQIGIVAVAVYLVVGHKVQCFPGYICLFPVKREPDFTTF